MSSKGFGRWRGGVIIVLTVLVLAAAAYIFIPWNSDTTVTSKTIEFSLKDMGELATQAGYWTNVQTINDKRKVWGIEILGTERKYVYSYSGVIKAGLDFEAIEVDMDNESKVVTVILPEIKILSIEVDENSFHMYYKTDNIFNPHDPSDSNVAMEKLKEEVRETAKKHGIFENARSNAEVLIRGFLATVIDLREFSVVFE